MFPSHFVPAEPSAALPEPVLEDSIQILDCFGVGFFGWPLDNLWCTAIDGAGNLRAVPLSQKARLPAPLQVGLNAQLLRGPPRALEAEQLFLFALEQLEPLSDTPGFNDPGSLRGQLFGPFPAHPRIPAAPQACRGQLCVSRADVIEGLVSGEPFAFHGAAASDRGAARTCHLMLPPRAAESPPGRPTVLLAYPLPASRHRVEDNTRQCAGIAYDVLSRLQQELKSAKVRGAFPDAALPAPAPPAEEQPPGRSSASWLSRLFSGLRRKPDQLPPEKALPHFLRLGRLALETIGWPSAQAIEIRRLCRVLEARWPAAGIGALVRVPSEPTTQEKNGQLWLRCKNKLGANGVFRVPPELFGADRPCASVLELEVEWLDDEGGGSICYVPAGKDAYEIHARYALTKSGAWKKACFRIPDARTDGKLWNGDVAVYFHHSRPLRIRGVKVRVQRPEWLAVEKQRCRGDLDALGGLDRSQQVMVRPASETDVLPFSGWVLDLDRGTAQGEVHLLLRSEQGEWAFPAAQRSPRPDRVAVFGGAFEGAGFAGALPLQGVPPGLYRVVVRLRNGEDSAQVEVATSLRLT